MADRAPRPDWSQRPDSPVREGCAFLAAAIAALLATWALGLPVWLSAVGAYVGWGISILTHIDWSKRWTLRCAPFSPRIGAACLGLSVVLAWPFYVWVWHRFEREVEGDR